MSKTFVTATGREFDPYDMKSSDVAIEDICRGMSRIKRYNGQIDWTVGQHLIVGDAYIATRYEGNTPSYLVADFRRYWLLHDFAEYVVGDMISPVKQRVGGKFEEVESLVALCIRDFFGIKRPLQGVQELVDEVDQIVCTAEMDALLNYKRDTLIDMNAVEIIRQAGHMSDDDVMFEMATLIDKVLVNHDD